MTGRLVLCGTPIGNLEDITPRAVRALTECDVIACEDPARTRKLLSHLGIAARSLVTVNEGSERRMTPRVCDLIARGRTVVLVTSAGMPGISDPGFHLVRACIDKGLEVEVVPGPSAAVAALVLSGLPPGRFVFEGFLPRRPGERRRHIESLAAETRTIVLFESPHRLAACLADLHDLLGDRGAAIARELTKLHEEVRRGSLSELRDWALSAPVRGEVAVVVSGARSGGEPPSPDELAGRARALMAEGVERREAMARVAAAAGVSRRDVFDALVREKRERREGRG